jgi:hypothetical protein
MNEIFVVTHGDKTNGPNPRMTPKGFEEIASLRHLLPVKIPVLVVGTGGRHLDVATALNYNEIRRYSSVVGDPDSMEVIDGEKIVILSDGTHINIALYTSLADNSVSAKRFITGLADKTVVCSGRPFMIALGINGKSAAVYRILCNDGEIRQIDQMIAYGVFDPALQM